MLSLFRTNQTPVVFLLLGYALLLQLPWSLLSEASWASLLWPPLLVTATGWVMSSYGMRNNAARTVNQFPGVCCVLCWAMVPDFHVYHPVQPALLLLTVALLAIARVYKQSKVAALQFNAGFWLGVATLFDGRAAWFLPLLIVGIAIVRTPGVRSILQVILGWAVPIFLFGSYQFYRMGWALDAGAGLPDLGWIGVPSLPLFSSLGLYLLSALALWIVVAASGNVRPLNIQGRKAVSFIYWLLLAVPFVLLVNGPLEIAAVQYLIAPLGFLMGCWLVRLPARSAEALHFVLVAAAIAINVLALAG